MTTNTVMNNNHVVNNMNVTVNDNGGITFTPVEHDSSSYAKNSSFYNQIMNDGYIFNPYIQRRWLPQQYIRMMNTDSNVNNVIRNYGAAYSFKVVKDEVDRLALLSRMDHETFNERKMFYSLSDCKAIINDYLDQVISYCNDIQLKPYVVKNISRGENRVKIGGIYLDIMKERKTIKRTKKGDTHTKVTKDIYTAPTEIAFCETLKDTVNLASSYTTLNEILKSCKLPKINGTVSDIFIECYKKSGAYYTLRELVTFNGCSLKNFTNPHSAVNYMKECLNNGMEAYKFHAMLKECISDNNFDTGTDALNTGDIFDGWKR